MKPVAIMSISKRTSGALLYELRAGGTIVWESLGYDSESGRARVRERLRAWLREHPHQVELASPRRTA